MKTIFITFTLCFIWVILLNSSECRYTVMRAASISEAAFTERFSSNLPETEFHECNVPERALQICDEVITKNEFMKVHNYEFVEGKTMEKKKRYHVRQKTRTGIKDVVLPLCKCPSQPAVYIQDNVYAHPQVHPHVDGVTRKRRRLSVMKPVIIWASFIIVVVTHYVEGFSVLHRILRINESATVDELRVAYERLLQQWYEASRSFSTEAELLHLKIVQAYRELKTEMEIDFHENHILTADRLKSNVQTLGMEVLHSLSVPLTTYDEKLIKGSDKNLHLILFYTPSSTSTRIIHNWFNLLEMLTPLGVVMVTINMDNETVDVAKNVIGEYPPSFPYLILLIDRVVVHYRNDEFIDFMIIEFIRRNLPDNLLQTLTDVSSQKFLTSWHNDSKVRALFFQPSFPPRLQYSMIAFLHRNTVSFGFINLEDERVKNTSLRLNVSKELDTFMMFKEDQQSPAVKISMPTLPSKLLNDTISKNNMLILPRITSQETFDSMCPISSGVPTHTPLCVVLVIKNSLNVKVFDPKIAFRKFIQQYSHYFDRVSFMYVYNDYQPGFVLPIRVDSQEFDDAPYVVALERINKNQIKYKVLVPDRSDWESYENVEDWLKISIEEIQSREHLLLVDTLYLDDFVSETPPGLFQRMLYRLQTYRNKVTVENLLPYAIFLGTVFYFIVYFTSYWNKVQCFWNTLVEAEDQALLKSNEVQMPLQPRKKREVSPDVFMKNDKCITNSRELRLHELKAETYNGMVRLLKPGCRTIILMFDRERADLLVSQFYKAVWPYRKNKNLLFGYLNTEKRATLEWYSELVKSCLPEHQEVEINPYFCAGTVLALSGMRKYFCLYHRKHPGIVPSKDKFDTPIQLRKSNFTDDELLIGLRDWLDRLFDGSGSLIRYRVNHWPEFKIL